MMSRMNQEAMTSGLHGHAGLGVNPLISGHNHRQRGINGGGIHGSHHHGLNSGLGLNSLNGGLGSSALHSGLASSAMDPHNYGRNLGSSLKQSII
jgi:hypothetical protein